MNDAYLRSGVGDIRLGDCFRLRLQSCLFRHCSFHVSQLMRVIIFDKRHAQYHYNDYNLQPTTSNVTYMRVSAITPSRRSAANIFPPLFSIMRSRENNCQNYFFCNIEILKLILIHEKKHLN